MNGKEKLSPINVIATDYDNWYVLYACSDLLGGNMMYGNWLSINTRYNTKITDEHKAAAEAAILAQLPGYDLSNFAMWNTSQEKCEYDWSLCGPQWKWPKTNDTN